MLTLHFSIMFISLTVLLALEFQFSVVVIGVMTMCVSHLVWLSRKNQITFDS